MKEQPLLRICGNDHLQQTAAKRSVSQFQPVTQADWLTPALEHLLVASSARPSPTARLCYCWASFSSTSFPPPALSHKAARWWLPFKNQGLRLRGCSHGPAATIWSRSSAEWVTAERCCISSERPIAPRTPTDTAANATGSLSALPCPALRD